jgi:phospholipid/cholesterol/gamma-HCH transport system permease protein
MKNIQGNNNYYVKINKEIAYHFVSDTLFINSKLTLSICSDFTHSVIKSLKSIDKKNLIFNLDQLEDIDSAGVTTLFYVKDQLLTYDKDVVFSKGNEIVQKKIDLFKPKKWLKPPTPERISLSEQIGGNVHQFLTNYLYSFLVLAADVFYWSVADIFRSKTRRKGEFVNQSVLIGVNAALIVIFMSFVIGLVLALQSAQQLREFGANIYIVDLVVVGMMSQMGPLITGILVAGRSGSSIAAEIATMKVTTELDALKTMGLDPIRFVVVPKLYASLFTMPFLVLLSYIFGILGGAITANIYLDITPEIFISRMGRVMDNIDIVTAFVKSQAYASLIVLTGSFYGFRVVRGAEGVGKVTTAAVVVSISLVIIADSILGLIFY